jgi:hypothetical protein
MWSQALFRHKKDPFHHSEKSHETVYFQHFDVQRLASHREKYNSYAFFAVIIPLGVFPPKLDL